MGLMLCVTVTRFSNLARRRGGRECIMAQDLVTTFRIDGLWKQPSLCFGILYAVSETVCIAVL